MRLFLMPKVFSKNQLTNKVGLCEQSEPQSEPFVYAHHGHELMW
jgi:hypothetical protein